MISQRVFYLIRIYCLSKHGIRFPLERLLSSMYEEHMMSKAHQRLSSTVLSKADNFNIGRPRDLLSTERAVKSEISERIFPCDTLSATRALGRARWSYLASAMADSLAESPARAAGRRLQLARCTQTSRHKVSQVINSVGTSARNWKCNAVDGGKALREKTARSPS